MATQRASSDSHIIKVPASHLTDVSTQTDIVEKKTTI
ncbi:MAG: hypothetical protein K1060chlam1_00924 [Candidatus Anoxychlamydiales bacterium]|nr:hypothetical protein [Candidatus Anoxychlamydiales bacterium]